MVVSERQQTLVHLLSSWPLSISFNVLGLLRPLSWDRFFDTTLLRPLSWTSAAEGDADTVDKTDPFMNGNFEWPRFYAISVWISRRSTSSLVLERENLPIFEVYWTNAFRRISIRNIRTSIEARAGTVRLISSLDLAEFQSSHWSVDHSYCQHWSYRMDRFKSGE